MKTLIMTALLGAVCFGSYHLVSAQAAPKVAPTCDATVTCTPEGNCKVTCTNDAGETCSIEIACDGDECHIVGCDGPKDCQTGCAAQTEACCEKP